MQRQQTGTALDPEMKIKKNYARKTETQASTEAGQKTQVQKCTKCKQNINKSEWKEHFKICNLDSKWKEQKQMMIDRSNNTIGTGDEITQNLRRFYN